MSTLAVILTDQCNFRCRYCYEPRGKERLDFSTLVKGLDFLYQFFAPDCYISLYGGEPLLAFGTLKRAVDHLDRLSTRRRIQLRYSLTTNGSLLNEDILGFLADHRFSLALSFDGSAQDLQRKKGTYELLSSIIPQILARPRISLETNSVFGADTVDRLSESVQSIIGLGVPKLDVNFAHKPPWTAAAFLRLKKEMRRLGEFFLSRYKNLADIPWPGFYEKSGRAVRRCPAGQDRMALSAQGTLWGCAVFPHYFAKKSGKADYDKYCFGDVDSFIKDSQRIYAQKMVNYSELSMDRFATHDRSCRKCRDIDSCWVCPLAAALTTGKIGRIPRWSCRGGRILRKERQYVLDRYEKSLQQSRVRLSV